MLFFFWNLKFEVVSANDLLGLFRTAKEKIKKFDLSECLGLFRNHLNVALVSNKGARASNPKPKFSSAYYWHNRLRRPLSRGPTDLERLLTSAWYCSQEFVRTSDPPRAATTCDMFTFTLRRHHRLTFHADVNYTRDAYRNLQLCCLIPRPAFIQHAHIDLRDEHAFTAKHFGSLQIVQTKSVPRLDKWNVWGHVRYSQRRIKLRPCESLLVVQIIMLLNMLVLPPDP